MKTSFKSKKKNSYHKGTSDALANKFSKTQKNLNGHSQKEDKSENVSIKEKSQKSIVLNLQIPSYYSTPILGLESPKYKIDSSKEFVIKKKKSPRASALSKMKSLETERKPTIDNMIVELEDDGNEIQILEKELIKRLNENRSLKKELRDKRINDDAIDDLMINFKKRLYNFLHE